MTLDLPLFADQNRRVSRRDKLLARQAPRAVEVATPTRDLAHKVVTYDPEDLNQKQIEVYNAFNWRIGEEPLDGTNAEVAYQLGWPINRVCPRTFELTADGPHRPVMQTKVWRVAEHHEAELDDDG